MVKKQNISTGYQALETLLEQNPPKLDPMLERMDQFATLTTKSKSAKEKAAFKHAASAYQRFFELVSHLLKIKGRLQKEKGR